MRYTTANTHNSDSVTDDAPDARTAAERAVPDLCAPTINGTSFDELTVLTVTDADGVVTRWRVRHTYEVTTTIEQE